MQVKLLSILFFILMSVTVMAGDDQLGTLEVFRHDGSLQCEPNTGIGLTQMKEQLEAAGVLVISLRKGSDGRMYPAVCGAGTGVINIYEISETQLAVAQNLGFQRYHSP